MELKDTIVVYHIGVEEPISPDVPLPEFPEIPRGCIVALEGRAPIWRYAIALHRLHGCPAAALAVYDPRLGGVIVQSHSPDYREGQIVNMTI